jgi:restriction system protein
MAVPTFEDMMLPLLKFLEDGKRHTINEAEDHLSKELRLTKEEMVQKKPSGNETLFHNRLHWAKFYLKKAGLVESPPRSPFKITARGESVLEKNPKIIDIEYLKKFEEFSDFVNRKKIKKQ